MGGEGACLYLWPGSPARQLRILEVLGPDHQPRRASSALVISADEERLAKLLGRLRDGLNREDLSATRAMLLPGCERIGTDSIPLVRTLDELVAQRLSESAFRALQDNRLEIHFQPVAEAVRPDHPFGYEALLRIRDDEGHVQPPERVLRAAEREGLVLPLNLAIVSGATSEASRLGLGGVLLLNLDPAVLVESLLPAEVMEALVLESGVPPSRIILEIVETLAQPREEELRTILEPYRRLGFRIALDDLGAGHSSLNLLHMVRPDLVKLDMALVRGLDTDRYKSTLVRQLIDLAHSLGIPVVAEGIEDTAELEWVQAHGADYVQGWLIGRPGNPPPPPGPPA